MKYRHICIKIENKNNFFSVAIKLFLALCVYNKEE